ncbi:RNA polymerase II C-terminal domain phosphatase-like 4 [Bienertia sinuspersici]
MAANNPTESETKPFHYMGPNLRLTTKETRSFRDVDLQELIKRRKLHLVLDLDHTLVLSQKGSSLTMEQKKAMKSMQDYYVISDNDNDKVLVKLRPRVREFLIQVSDMFDLWVYTLGSRAYATRVVELLESEVPSVKIWNVISSEDCFKYRVKGLDVVLAHENVVLVVDDSEHVWGECYRKNLINVKRYDINSISNDDRELDKDEKDKVHGYVTMSMAIYQVEYRYHSQNGDARGKLSILVLHSLGKNLINIKRYDENSLSNDDKELDKD